jgi:hypothetical protein
MSRKEPKMQTCTQELLAAQLPRLVGPMREILADGVREKGYDPVAIALSMLIAGVTALQDAAGDAEALEVLRDLADSIIDGEDLDEGQFCRSSVN